jgi:hypothetical protein
MLNNATDATIKPNSINSETGNVLFGATLVAAIESVIRAAAGNSAKAQVHANEVGQLVLELANFASSQRQLVGRLEWLALFRHHLASVIDSGQLPVFTAENLLLVLQERQG